MGFASCWSIFGFLTGLVGSLLIILAFATPYWIEPDQGHVQTTGLERLGLWEICFSSYSDYRDGLGRVYNGCWWIFAREYDAIRQYIITSWFAASQALMTISVILTMLNNLVGLLVLIKCMPSTQQKYAALYLLSSNLIIGVLIAVSSIYFGSHAGTDRSWLKQPRFRHLSWSFYLAVMGGIAALFSCMCYCVYYIMIRKGGSTSTAYRAHEMRSYRHHESANRYYR
ncbi:uncharacterized protein LOC128204498 [Mya arenaria]|uniref:uncharacterized protein LOC128204498 n=1 Tax=Mya arenaria TaxID=6604 RepID=UPI0022E2A0C3|nr:uncharacterized protein LOC128204498 [Mya arenaria]